MDNQLLTNDDKKTIAKAMELNLDFTCKFDATRTYGEKQNLEYARELHKIASGMVKTLESIPGVLPDPIESTELRIPVTGLAAAYGDDEPEYTLEDLEYRNPYYGMEAEIIPSYELEKMSIQDKNKLYTLIGYDSRPEAKEQNTCKYIKAASQKDAILRAQMEWESICEYKVPEWYNQEKIELSLYTFMSKTKGDPIWTNKKEEE